MPPRKLEKTTAQKHELEAFAEKYDTLVLLYGDPVEMVFRIMADSEEEDTQLRAAEMLMSYRYPRVKATEVVDNNKGPQMTMTINLGAPQAHPEIEVKAAPALELKSG